MKANRRGAQKLDFCRQRIRSGDSGNIVHDHIELSSSKKMPSKLVSIRTK
jgi:hypothetical protein